MLYYIIAWQSFQDFSLREVLPIESVHQTQSQFLSSIQDILETFKIRIKIFCFRLTFKNMDHRKLSSRMNSFKCFISTEFYVVFAVSFINLFSSISWNFLLPTTLPIYIYIYIYFCSAATQRGSWSPHAWGFLITQKDALQSVGFLWTSDQLVAETSTWQHTTLTIEKHPCPWWDSNTRSQQASGRRPTP